MLNMTQINDIRDLAKSGYSISKIHEITGYDRKTVSKFVNMDDFSPQPPAQQKRSSIIDPYLPKIMGYLEEDTKHWQKQHHTALRIYNRLKDEEGYTGSYSTVQKLVKDLKVGSTTKGTQELQWYPAEAQVDFGEADFYEGGECIRRKYLAVSFPYSNDGFCQVFGGETSECVCQGLKDIFEYIGGVPVTLVFDNATGVGKRVMEKVVVTNLFERFMNHYMFKVKFCNPYAGYEKGNVENKVGTIRRNMFVPVQRYDDIEKYNVTLLDRHKEKAGELHYKKGIMISELFKEDQKALLPLPAKPFNVCRYDIVSADGYGNICLEGKHYYSTQPEYHNQKVTVGIRAHYIEILKPDGTILVKHRRKYGEERTDTRDYTTSLNMLSKNIGAWDNSGYRSQAPDFLRELIDSQEKAERKKTIQLLNQLTSEYGYNTAIDAIQRSIESNDVDLVSTATLAAKLSEYGVNIPVSAGPSLSDYDKVFLSGKESANNECNGAE